MSSIIGRFHPLLVHLPIGILLLACLFSFLIKKEKYVALKPALGIALFWGMLSAIASCITGFLLSKSGDYDEAAVYQHQWLGIATAITASIFYYFYRKNKPVLNQKWLPITLIGLIMITGHLGGSLTHGSDYLTAPLSILSSETVSKPIQNVQEAIVFKDIIQPIMQSKCTSCHGETKQKGGLRMDKFDFILRGGKNGVVVIASNTDSSKLLTRLLLPRENDKHMPPKEKPQLTESEIALLHWWIASGASNDKKVKDLPPSDKIKPLLAALQNGGEKKKIALDMPENAVEKADEAAVKQLRDMGVVVQPVTQNSNYLSANFVTVKDSIIEKAIPLLLPLKKQLIWLKIGDKPVNDALLQTISELNNLTKLYLNNTEITDKGLFYLKNSDKLTYLNLIKTPVTAQGVMQLKDLKNLQSLFLYQSQVAKSDFLNLQKAFPNAVIDSGGYSLPFLTVDTMRVKPPPIAK